MTKLRKSANGLQTIIESRYGLFTSQVLTRQVRKSLLFYKMPGNGTVHVVLRWSEMKEQDRFPHSVYKSYSIDMAKTVTR